VSMRVVPLTRQTLPSCASLWADRPAYQDGEMGLAHRAAAGLLDEQRALGIIICDGERVCGFGLTLFVDNSFADSYLAEPSAQLGRQLLLSCAHAHSSVLGIRAIGEGNASRGLTLVVANANYDVASRDPNAVMGHIISAFQQVHRGYRLARIINEAIGETNVGVIKGSFDICRSFTNVGGVDNLTSAVGVLTRERAYQTFHPLMSMFVYEAPRIIFTPAEQALLRASLDGSTNDRIAARLAIPVSAVRARWARVQERAFQRVPDLFRDLPDAEHERGRGPQSRHLIIEYVRRHPSELTPYTPAEREDSARAR
jgi:hypothetical protein